MVQGALAQKEAYAVLSDDGKTVTFYYDDQKGSRSGVVEINNTDGYPRYSSATNAIIDESFKDYRPTSTAYWFQYCSKLASISGMDNLNTENVTDMKWMFTGCSALTSLDLSNFNTENVTDMNSMFLDCQVLKTIYADETKLSTAKITSSGYDMFYNCINLKGGNGTVYGSSHTNHEYARIDRPGLPGYLTGVNDCSLSFH